MRTPSLIPDKQQPHDVTVYIVLNDFGQLGHAYVETDEAKADEKTVLNNIISGEYSNPIRVVAFSPKDGPAMSQRTLPAYCSTGKRRKVT